MQQEYFRGNCYGNIKYAFDEILHSMRARARVLCISNLVFEHFVLENILSLRKYSSILSKRITEGLVWCGGQVFSWKMSAIRIIDDKCKHSARQ